MDVDSRIELKHAENELKEWAEIHRNERCKYGKAVKELGIILASKNIRETLSFENKVVQLLKENNPVFETLWTDYIMSEQKYKSAELLWKTYEHKVNNIKFQNRLIT